MNQTTELLALLRERGDTGVTALDALSEVGTFRLAARIWDLRHDGYRITTHMDTLPSGKIVARYRLVPDEVQAAMFFGGER